MRATSSELPDHSNSFLSLMKTLIGMKRFTSLITVELSAISPAFLKRQVDLRAEYRTKCPVWIVRLLRPKRFFKRVTIWCAASCHPRYEAVDLGSCRSARGALRHC